MSHTCFLLHVRPEKMAEYREAHEAVWPEMLRALKASDWNDYSLYLDDTGIVVGFVDTRDFEAAMAAMSRTEIDAKWQQTMAPYFVDAGAPVRALPRVFHLETQLAALDPSGQDALA